MHSRLEEYLETVDRRLHPLPAWERDEWREEARQHLEALAEAYEELGSTPEEALTAAIRQFGDPTRLGKDLAAAASLEDAREASHRLAASLHMITWYVVVTIAAVNTWVYGVHLAQAAGAGGGSLTWTALLVFWLGLGLGGAALGRWTGRPTLGRAVVLPYLALVLAGLLLTETASVFSPLAALGAAAVTGAGLALSSAAARWGARRRSA